MPSVKPKMYAAVHQMKKITRMQLSYMVIQKIRNMDELHSMFGDLYYDCAAHVDVRKYHDSDIHQPQTLECPIIYEVVPYDRIKSEKCLLRFLLATL